MKYWYIKSYPWKNNIYIYIDPTLLHAHIHLPLGTFREVIDVQLFLTEYDAIEITTQFVNHIFAVMPHA